MNVNKKVTQFEMHIDNSKEIITANDINRINTTINDIEKTIIESNDNDFVSNTMFILENNNFVNSLFIDDLTNPYKIFNARTVDAMFNDNEKAIMLIDSCKSGEVMSTAFKTKYNSSINKVMMMVNDYIPKGAKIIYYISFDGVTFFPIKPNTSVISEFDVQSDTIFMKARLIKNSLNQTPKIYGWSLLYFDNIVEKLYGLTNLDLTRYDTDLIGDTVLVRDKNNDDKLVMVLSPSGTTELNYDKINNRLDHVVEKVGDRTIMEKLNYGKYLNSKSEYEETLLGTTSKLIKDK